MPSYNGILTISCIHTLTKIALKLSPHLQHVHVIDILKPYRAMQTTPWQVRIEAGLALLELEFYYKGVDSSLTLYFSFLNEEPSFRGQVKLTAFMMRLCQMKEHSGGSHYVNNSTLVYLLSLLDSQKAFNNVLLRHGLFSILQALAQRPPTLFGVLKAPMRVIIDVEDIDDLKMRSSSLKLRIPNHPPEPSVEDTHQKFLSNRLPDVDEPAEETKLVAVENFGLLNTNSELVMESFETTTKGVVEVSKELSGTVSGGNERKVSVVKIRLKQSAASSRVVEVENDNRPELSGVKPYEGEVGPSSIISVDGPLRSAQEPTSTSCQNIVEFHSSGVYGSSTKDGEVNKELQCTADSKIRGSPSALVISPPAMTHERTIKVLANSSVGPAVLESADKCKDTTGVEGQTKEGEKEKHKKKKHKDKKRKEDKKHAEDGKVDLEYLERKKLKKQRKKEEKERAKEKAKLLGDGPDASVDTLNQGSDVASKVVSVDEQQPVQPFKQKEEKAASEGRIAAGGVTIQNRLRIKLKSGTKESS